MTLVRQFLDILTLARPADEQDEEPPVVDEISRFPYLHQMTAAIRRENEHQRRRYRRQRHQRS